MPNPLAQRHYGNYQGSVATYLRERSHEMCTVFIIGGVNQR